ncbi:amino acid adenylation domain-containing protein [Streptomyces bambusae]|nr:amino acid adenylation domain-containing protein [Streptomyces bambusae]
MPGAFEAQAAREPDRIALIGEDETLTYGEFNKRANRLAHWLVEQGAGPEKLVAVKIPRSVDLMVAIYAVVKAGAAYVPIDTELPEDRVRLVLDSANPLLVLDAGLPDVSAYPETDPQRALTPDHAAYAIFTSGSTGRPKGVQVAHGAIMNRLKWGLSHFSVGTEDRVLLSTTASFDVSVPEIFAPLQVGAAVVIARPDGRRDPAYLADLIQRENVTGADFVPSLLEAFVNEPGAKECSSLRWIEVAGEAFPPALANRVSELLPELGVHNLYGPTEASVEVTAYRHVPGADRVPIGAPVWNTQVYVLDAALRPVAPGVSGELYLAGTGLARGYLGQTGLTSTRFVACPFGEPGSRMYRTGDVVRWNAEGQVEYIGRSDFQVKLRGFRIELGDIEQAIAAHPDVESTVALVREDRPGDQRLVAYVVPAAGKVPAQLDPAALTDLARESLPEYMVPSAIVPLAELPSTPSGKLDRKALPVPDLTTEAVAGRGPRNQTEEVLCRLFAELLGLPEIGIDADFFDNGGHSLLATRLTGRIRNELKVDVKVTTVFRSPTVAQLAEKLAETGTSNRPSLRPMLRPMNV